MPSTLETLRTIESYLSSLSLNRDVIKKLSRIKMFNTTGSPLDKMLSQIYPFIM